MSSKGQKHPFSTVPEHHILSTETQPLLEKLLFNNRFIVLTILLALTAVFAFGLTKVRLDSSVEKYIPLGHEYIKNFIVHKDSMKSGVTNVKISVETREGDIFTKEYLETLSKINDDVFFIKGVDRSANC